MCAFLKHYGMPRRSGRYPWGSGKNPYQRNADFLRKNNELAKQGVSEKERAEFFGFQSTAVLRNRVSIAKSDNRAADISRAQALKDKGYTNTKIGEMMGINESSVRELLKPTSEYRANLTREKAEELRALVDEKGPIDVGAGAELSLGISKTKVDTALSMLKEEGYNVWPVQVEQLGTGHKTTIKTLAPPGMTYSDLYKNRFDISSIEDYTIDVDGKHHPGSGKEIKSISSNRVKIAYAEDGGSDKDGVIELRRGVDDISLGNAKYAQVRISVDGTHYLKGMAMYSDDIPDGYDIVFNTNKKSGTPKEKVFKELKADPDNKFGATIKDEDKLRLVQKYYTDKNGEKQLSALNVVNEEGDWDSWSRTLSSQFLSKQEVPLAKRQLNLAYSEKVDEFNEIKSLTNPSVKKKLLESFADDCDSSAEHLKAAALPRQTNKVILPITSLKENEIYAPGYRNGEQVVLVRHPHGGTFEIPELTVNNKNETANRVIFNATDAVGINSKVASRLSGADFDGDTVLVIPVNNVKIKTSPPLDGLKDFDPKEKYALPDDAPKMKNQTKQLEMGKVSNLITDMTLKGAKPYEIERAVKHSMVVIDAEKHHLDYKKSEIDNGINELKKKYQIKDEETGKYGGASTLISKASSEIRVGERIEGYKPDPETGEKTYRYTGRTYTKDGKEIEATIKSTQMAEAKDAFDLSSGTPMETVYANFANRMKAMGNEARKESLAIKEIKANPSAKEQYANEVASLEAKRVLALKNAPKERQAQLKANYIYETKKNSNPDMDKNQLKKAKSQALATARTEVGAKKPYIDITDKEWEAIQSGAISPTKLRSIINNTDLDQLKKLSMPKQQTQLSSTKVARIKAMSASGFSTSEIADALGISTSTVSSTINGT